MFTGPGKFIGYIKNRNVPTAPFLALKERLTAAADIGDLGVRLLELQDIAKQALEENNKKGRAIDGSSFLPGMLPWALICAFTVVAATNPLTLFVSTVFAGVATGGFIGRAIAKRDTDLKLGRETLETSKAQVEKLLGETDPLAYTASSKFDEIMSRHPDLKTRFTSAAVRDAAKTTNSPALKMAAKLQM